MLPMDFPLHYLVSLLKMSQDLQIIMLAALVLLAIAGSSDAAYYCICNDELSDAIYQKNIDYACGAGADCTPIMQNGTCFQPNTAKDHCNFAVNSYYQRNGQVQGSCSFSNTATLAKDPLPAISESVYPSSPRAVEKPIINFSLSIKITVATALVVIVIGLLKLFPRLNEGESHQEAANHENVTVEIEASTVGSPFTIA